MADERPAGREKKRRTQKVFEPETVGELLLGWQLHVSRRRDIHEQAARNAQVWSFVVGVPTAVLAGLAGASAVGVWQSGGSNGTLAIIGGVLGLVAAILASVQAFLDLGSRAERHRQAAISYKRVLRSFERIPASDHKLSEVRDDSQPGRELQRLQAELAEVDGAAPVVPRRIAEKVEDRPMEVVLKACELAPPRTPSSP
jgi:hypothetical protein